MRITIKDSHLFVSIEGDYSGHAFYFVFDVELLGLVAVYHGKNELAAAVLQLSFDKHPCRFTGRTPSILCVRYSVKNSAMISFFLYLSSESLLMSDTWWICSMSTPCYTDCYYHSLNSLHSRRNRTHSIVL